MQCQEGFGIFVQFLHVGGKQCLFFMQLAAEKRTAQNENRKGDKKTDRHLNTGLEEHPQYT
jgi:hypothetical protein